LLLLVGVLVLGGEGMRVNLAGGAGGEESCGGGGKTFLEVGTAKFALMGGSAYGSELLTDENTVVVEEERGEGILSLLLSAWKAASASSPS
jgi:hypothetical protein